MERHRITAAGAIFVVAFATYLMTLAPTVGFVDSGELTVAARYLGVAHPPGFPLYLLFTRAVMLIPAGTIAWRANLASGLAAAVAATAIALAAAEIVLAEPRRVEAAKTSGKRRKANIDSPRTVDPPRGSQVVGAMLVAGLCFTFSRTLWGYATTAEVYSLHMALMCLVAWLLLAWCRDRNDMRLYAAAVLFAGGLAVHHVTAGLMAVAFLFLLLACAGTRFVRSPLFLKSAAIAVVTTTALYAYLPLRARTHPPMNWGDPETFRRFVDHVTGAQYRRYFTAAKPAEQLSDFWKYTVRDFGPGWLPLVLIVAAIGAAWLARRQRMLLWFIVLVPAMNLMWFIVYPIVNDRDAYVLPTLMSVALLAACGAAALLSRVQSRYAAVVLILPFIALVANLPYRNRRHYRVAEHYFTNVFGPLAPHSLLLTNDWQVYSPAIYFTEAEGRRPDVRVIQTGLLIRSWYIEALERRYPELMRDVRAELSAYRPLLAISERGGPAWDDVATRDRFNARFDDLVMALIERQRAHAPVYATLDVAASRDPVEANLVKRLTTAYDIVPNGIALELLPGHAIRTLRPGAIDTGGLNDGSIRYEVDDVEVKEVIPAYRSAFLMRGRYLAITRRYAEAAAAYQEALELDPENRVIERELNTVRAAQ